MDGCPFAQGASRAVYGTRQFSVRRSREHERATCVRIVKDPFFVNKKLTALSPSLFFYHAVGQGSWSSSTEQTGSWRASSSTRCKMATRLCSSRRCMAGRARFFNKRKKNIHPPPSSFLPPESHLRLSSLSRAPLHQPASIPPNPNDSGIGVCSLLNPPSGASMHTTNDPLPSLPISPVNVHLLFHLFLSSPLPSTPSSSRSPHSSHPADLAI